MVVHLVVDGGLVQDEVAVVVTSVLDGVVGGVVEVFDGSMEVVAPLVGYVEFDGNGTLDLHLHTHTQTGILYTSGSRTATGVRFLGGRASAPPLPTRLCFRR